MILYPFQHQKHLTTIALTLGGLKNKMKKTVSFAPLPENFYDPLLAPYFHDS